jgi:hypothetical protein
MTTNNAIRLVSLAALMALSAPGSSGQALPASMSGSPEETGLAPTAQEANALAEIPPRPPKVTCNGDQLTISADNSTLGSVLTAIHACSGILIDTPPGSAGSRTYEEIGPGPVRQVLESLLSGTEFNYVIGLSDSNPQKVETVLLMLRTNDSPNAPAAGMNLALTPGRRAWLGTQKNGRAVAVSTDESRQVTSDLSGSSAADDALAAQIDNPVPNEPQSPAPSSELPAEMTAARVVNPVTVPPEVNSNSAQGKGTGEMINNMQQLFEQRRQMQQNQNTVPK